MATDIQIVKETEQPLLKRRAVTFHIDHPDQPTPRRKEMKSKLAVLLRSDEALVVVDSFRTKYGVNRTFGSAFAYADAASLAVAEGKKKVQKEKEGKAKKAAPAPAATGS